MAERDTEISRLELRIAELEARPTASDLDWLKNSRVFKRAEFAVSPLWTKINLLFIGFIWSLFIIPILYLIVTNRFM